jgi:hypothetical protein
MLVSVMRKRDSKPAGIIRELAADDPQALSHPCHREQWLELARAIGRQMADQDFVRDQEEATRRNAEGRRD